MAKARTTANFAGSGSSAAGPGGRSHRPGVLGGRPSTRDFHPAATTSVAFADLGVAHMAYHPSAATTVTLGQPADAHKAMFPSATTALGLADLGAGLRAVNAAAATVVQLTVTMRDTRILHLAAATAVTFRQEPSPLLGAIGGNPVASQLVGYLGRSSRARPRPSMLRATGYQGRIVTPGRGRPVQPLRRLGSVAVVRLPAWTRRIRVFALPVFLGLDLPVG